MSFLQSSFWASFKSRHGWSALCFDVQAIRDSEHAHNAYGQSVHGAPDGAADGQERGCMSFACSVLVRKIARRFSLAYIPMMPPLYESDVQLCKNQQSNAERNDALHQKSGHHADAYNSGEQRDARRNDALQTSCMPQTSEAHHERVHAAGGNCQASGEQARSSAQLQNESAHPAIIRVNEYVHFLEDFAAGLKPFLPRNTLCVRYDVPLDFASCSERDFFVSAVKTLAFADRLNIAKPRVDIQPPDTVLLDLQKSEDALLAAMKSKWRYNIRLAEKKGVVVKAYRADDACSNATVVDSAHDNGAAGDMAHRAESSAVRGKSDGTQQTTNTAHRAGGVQSLDNALDIFYELYKTTASRDGIAIHAKRYYEDMIHLSAQSRSHDMSNQQTAHSDTCGNAQHAESCNTVPLITVYVAFHEGEPLAAIITLFSKREAVYLYGASSNVKRNLMPAYLLQWTAIKDAKAYGSSVYDFYGMPPTDDKNHPMHGLYLFKTGFGGDIVHRPGSFDVPLSAWYKLYACAEKARAFYHKRVKKMLAGRT